MSLEDNTVLAEERRDEEIPVLNNDSDETSMEDLLTEEYSFKTLNVGDLVEGTVVKVSTDEILVDVGSKSEGSVLNREVEKGIEIDGNPLEVGDRVWVFVVKSDLQESIILLSVNRAKLEQDWISAKQAFESKEAVTGEVSGYNKGGLLVHWGNIRGFVPASQLDDKRKQGGRDRQAQEEFLSSLVGEELMLKIIEVDRSRNRLILSERDAMKEWRWQQRENLLNELQEGEIRTGTVSSLCHFGAFVDLGGADGLVHISELSWRRVNHPGDVVSVGDEVEVYVLNVDRERRRIALSIKRLKPEPWSLVDEKYHMGQLVEGVITKIAGFGAFARIDEYMEGLVHISELSNERILHPREVVQEGDQLTLRIIRIDSARRRIGLSLRRVADEEYADLDWQEALQEENWQFDDTAEEYENSSEMEQELEVCYQ